MRGEVAWKEEVVEAAKCYHKQRDKLKRVEARDNWHNKATISIKCYEPNSKILSIWQE